MKPNVLRALERVASISAESAELVQQIKLTDAGKDTPEQTIAKLTATITKLNAEISLLRMEAIPVDAQLSEDDIQAFAQSFTEYLSKLENIKTAMLGFNRAFFSTYSPQVRVVIATTLLNYCTNNDLSASDLWRDLVANTGYM